MIHHQGQISIPAPVIRGPVFVGTVISYSLAYNDADVIDNDSIAADRETQIQIRVLATIMCASIASRDRVRIALMNAALNDLEVQSGNILNAYVQTPVTEKTWTTVGPEYRKDAGKNAVIARVL